MRVSCCAILVVLGVLPATASFAVTGIHKNTTVDWFNDATFAQVTGQAVSQVASLGNTGSILLPGSTVSSTNCVILPDPSFSCTGFGAVVKQNLDLTAAGAPGSGVVALGTAVAGGDTVSMSLTATSEGAVIDGVSALLYNIVGIDRQRVTFDVALGTLPELIDIDVTFTVRAGISDHSTVPDAAYLAEASASLHILEASTLLAAPFATGSMQAPMVASAAVNNSGGELEAILMAVTETISIRPNAEYWVALESQTALSLVPSPGFPVRDYAGLDIELSAYADPVFALNPAFAALNPDIAGALQINRIAVVPLPAALPLLAAGLVGLLAVAARRKQSCNSLEP